MLPEKINIEYFVISMKHNRRFLLSSNYPQNEIQTGETTIGEYNIDEIINELKFINEINENKFFKNEISYYPKEIFNYMLPFLVKIIEKSILIKCIYSFGLYQQDPYQNPHDTQGIIKDIEVVLEFESPPGTAERLIKGCLEKMENHTRMVDDDLDNGFVLFVTRIEVFDNDEYSLHVSNTNKEDDCIICIEEKPNILFCNCGHMVICDKCFNKLENTKCPKCREINKIIRKI